MLRLSEPGDKAAEIAVKHLLVQGAHERIFEGQAGGDGGDWFHATHQNGPQEHFANLNTGCDVAAL